MTELIESREDVVAKLYDIWLARQAKNEATKVDKTLTEGVKNWLGLEGEEEIVDGERGVRAFIKEVGAEPTWDIRTAPDDLVLWLAKNGYLDVRTKKVDGDLKNAPATQLLDLNAKVNNVPKYRFPAVNYQLRVEKKD
jgi:hypothetical protein